MQAVLVEVNVSGVDRDEGVQALRERIVPAISQMSGFKSGTWLTGNERGTGLSLTLWETNEQAKAFAQRFGEGTSPQAGAFVERCEIRDVAATA